MKMKRLVFPIIVLFLAISCGGEEFDPAMETPSPDPTLSSPTPGNTVEAPSASPSPLPAPGDTPAPAATHSQPLPLESPFSLRPGQSQQVDDLAIALAGISEDSRCPPDVQCVWQGQVGIELEVIASGSGMETFALTSVMSPTATLPAYLVTLVSVEPGPAPSGSSIPLSDYVVTLQVSERDDP